MPKELQLVISQELREEIDGMIAEDKANAEFNQPPGGQSSILLDNAE